MKLPSGRTLETLDFVILRLMAEYGFIRWSEQVIHFNAVDSHVYVGGREDLTDNPDLEWFLGQKTAQLVLENARVRGDRKQQCLIGIPTAGTALAQAAAMVNWQRRRSFSDGSRRIIHRMMREERKTHGVHRNWVNGNPSLLRDTYWIVDNTVTDGGTKLEARGHLAEDGYPVQDMPVLILVDRQQGGIKRMEQAGFSNIVIAYYLLDLVYAFGQLDLWSIDAVRAVRQEIKAHQLVL